MGETCCTQNRCNPKQQQTLCKSSLYHPLCILEAKQQKGLFFFLPLRTVLQKPDCSCATPAQTSAPDRVQAMELWSPQGLRTLKFPCPGMWKPLFHPRMADFLYTESPGSCNNIRISARAHSFMHLHSVCCSFPLEITERKQICFCNTLISTLPRWSSENCPFQRHPFLGLSGTSDTQEYKQHKISTYLQIWFMSHKLHCNITSFSQTKPNESAASSAASPAVTGTYLWCLTMGFQQISTKPQAWISCYRCVALFISR